MLIATGANPKVLQVRLGHASVTITLERYSLLYPAQDLGLSDAPEAAHAPGLRPAAERH
jgi:hypothetical protein